VKARIAVSGAAIAVPALLYWYGATHCTELSCIGPFLNALIDVIVVVPLLVVWVVRRRPAPLAMLVLAELGMTVTTLRRDLDFSPRFTILGVACGLAAGALVGFVIERR
jgi:hypothetical protein